MTCANACSARSCAWRRCVPSWAAIDSGDQRYHAIELSGHAAWIIYRRLMAIPDAVVRLTTRDPAEHLKRDTHLIMDTFPFGRNPTANAGSTANGAGLSWSPAVISRSCITSCSRRRMRVTFARGPCATSTIRWRRCGADGWNAFKRPSPAEGIVNSGTCTRTGRT